MPNEKKSKKESEDLNLENFVPKVSESLAGKATSRKLFVWVAATVAFFLGKIDGETWAYVSMLYMSAQSILDFYKTKLGR